MKHALVTLGTMLLLAPRTAANNLQVSSATLIDADPLDGVAFVQFDINWENSWRTSAAPNNWDAAWVFVKFKVGASDPTLSGVNSTGATLTVASTANLRVGMPVHLIAGPGTILPGTVITAVVSANQITVSPAPTAPLTASTIICVRIWEHAYLGNNGTHFAPAGTTLTVGQSVTGPPLPPANVSVGAFIHRSTDGSGTFSAQGVQLLWPHGQQGVNIGTTVDVCVHATEMVRVPTGSYYAGGSGTNALRRGESGTTPYQVTDEVYIPYDAPGSILTLGISYGGPGLYNEFGSGFPKGYEGFYCMKYEITQAEYASYLNKLTRAQQSVSVATNILLGVSNTANQYVMSNTAIMTNRASIRCPASFDPLLPLNFSCDANGNGIGDESDDGQWTSANYINAPNALAYLDWCGLRPMSEMEFEKACRGSAAPGGGDLAWGAGAITLPTSQSAIHTSSENVDNTSNSSYNALAPNAGPFRAGMFAEPGATRLSAGASYYGIMDLSGNVAEYTISAAYLSLVFNRFAHGDGVLNSNGSHNAFPPVDGFTGYAPRGGSWSSIVQDQRVADRRTMSPFNTTRFADRGARGVRRAP